VNWVCHCSFTPNGFTEASRLENHYFNNVIGNPLDTTIAVSHLIFDGVMERNPKLKVLLAHAGGYLAHYWARMDHVYGARPDGPYCDQAQTFCVFGKVLL
jgi:aminocarboxymuconate-semialdehyde decarboxylase